MKIKVRATTKVWVNQLGRYFEPTVSEPFEIDPEKVSPELFENGTLVREPEPVAEPKPAVVPPIKKEQ